MKTTGIIRRIDDLGRIVIPRKIRRAMNICEGDLFEIYTNNEDCVMFRKCPCLEKPNTSKSNDTDDK